jgi:hypothetical protein
MRCPSVAVALPLALLLALPLTLGACLNEVDAARAPVGAAPDATESPLVGVSGSGDFADRSCQVVLRDLGRVQTATGFATSGSVWIFAARVDVSRAAIAEGYAPLLLGRAGSDASWRAHTPIASVAVDDDTERFLFEIKDGNLPGPGMSTTGLSRSRVRAIPFLQSADGRTRLFDHNRVVDDLATYDVGLTDAFSVAYDDAVCAPNHPTIRFDASGEPSMSGAIAPEADVVVHYDLSRLSTCRATHNGHPGWSTSAFARFLPGGAVVEAQVVRHGGGGSDPAPARFRVAAGATRMELWFRNTDVSGCEAWDSRLGQNYGFEVTEGARVRPDWIGDVGVTISRSASWACEGAAAIGSEITYGTWARSRAAVTSLCFEVYEPGVTDRENPDIWRDLDVQVHSRSDRSKPFTSAWVSLAGKDGDNAVYAVDLRGLDPFRPFHCTDAPTTSFTIGSEPYVRAEVELYMSVNGVELRPQGEQVFRVRYEDSASSPRSCP